MTDDLVQRLRRTYRKEFPVTGSMIADNSNRLRPFPILAAEVPFNPDGREAADLIESQAAEIERLQRSADSWEADALRYAQNAEYWKAEVEKYKSALGGTIIWSTP